MGDYSKIESSNEEIIVAGMKFLERCNHVRAQTKVFGDCQMQGNQLKSFNVSLCVRSSCRCLHFQRRNAIFEEQVLEREGLLIFLREHILQRRLQAICLR